MSGSADRPNPAPARARRWSALALLCFVQFMLVVDDTVVNVALPSIRDTLGFSTPGLAWVVNGYLLAFGGLILLGGRAGDILGHRRIFLTGVAVFAVASLACGSAHEPWQLVLARFLQGIGGAMASATALALITLLFDEGPERAKAIGLWGGIAALGGVVGYILSGVLTDLLSWRWVFLINLPVAVVVLVLVPRFVPARDSTFRGRIDVAGAVLGTAGLTALVYALLEAPSRGWSSTVVLSAAALSVALLLAFVVVESRLAQPLIPLGFFANRTRTAANITMMLFTTGLFAMFFLLTLHLQERLGWSPLQAGLAYLPMAATLLGAIALSGPLVARIGARAVLIIGPLTGAAGLLYLSGVSGQDSYLSAILPGIMLIALGSGLAVPVLATAAMSATTADDAGLASGMMTVAQQIGGALGLAVLVSLAGAHTRGLLGDGVDAESAATGGTELALRTAAVLMALGAVAGLAVRPQPAPSPPAAAAGDSSTSIGASS